MFFVFQELRKENLARFSSSCPSLDADLHNSPLPVIDEAGKGLCNLVLHEDSSKEDVKSCTCFVTMSVLVLFLKNY